MAPTCQHWRYSSDWQAESRPTAPSGFLLVRRWLRCSLRCYGFTAERISVSRNCPRLHLRNLMCATGVATSGDNKNIIRNRDRRGARIGTENRALPGSAWSGPSMLLPVKWSQSATAPRLAVRLLRESRSYHCILPYFGSDLINASRSCTCCILNLSPNAGMMRDLPLALPPLVIIAMMKLSVSS